MTERAQEQEPPADPERPEEAARRRWPRRTLQGLLAFGVYLAGSLLIWGGSMLAHLSTYYIPRQDSPDSDFFRWAFAWTPWALTHGRSPLFSDVVFAPTGASLTWVTISPGPALAAWPITRAFGPLAAYNVLVLLAPPLAAWAAYLLCRRLTDRFLRRSPRASSTGSPPTWRSSSTTRTWPCCSRSRWRSICSCGGSREASGRSRSSSG